MTRKRFIKLLMSYRMQRNAAVRQAAAARQFAGYEVVYMLLKDLLIDAAAKYVLSSKPLELRDIVRQIKMALEFQRIIEENDRMQIQAIAEHTGKLITEDDYRTIRHNCRYIRPVEPGSLQYTLDMPYLMPSLNMDINLSPRDILDSRPAIQAPVYFNLKP